MKPRLLDLFCGAGGAAMGYHRAGFDVVGVDIKPMPRYPFEFHQADAMEYCAEHGREFDVIHASPPCQDYSPLKYLTTHKYPRLIGSVRELLIHANKPYVIENVQRAGKYMINPIMLCGEYFNLGVYRHRMFEASFPLPFLLHRPHGLSVDKLSGPYEKRKGEMVTVCGNAQYKGYRIRASQAMGIDWYMNENELGEAIPPAYTEFIGKQLIARLYAA